MKKGKILVKKKLTGKQLSTHLKRNLDEILVADHKQALNIIKTNYQNYQIDITTSVGEIRKLIVDRIGRSLLLNETSNLSKEDYLPIIENIEEETDLLRYNKSGKQLYDVWIAENIEKFKTINKVKYHDNKNISVDQLEHLLTKVKTEKVELDAKKKEEELKGKLKEYETKIENTSNILIIDKEDTFEDEIEDEESLDQLWWEKIGLIQSPFNINGLSKINKEDYDHILVDNPAIKKAKEFRSGDINSFSLGSNYMILGRLGTGKTAVVDYVKEFSINNRIESFIARMPQAYSVSEMIQNFYNQMQLNIKKWYRQNNINNNNIGNAGETEFILGLDEIINVENRGGLNGFFIFIEDLHKQRNEEITFDFISTLQTLTESLFDFNIKCSIIITGIPEWEEQVKNNPNLTSVISTSNIIKIQNITPSVAAKAIEKRFDVFREDRSSAADSYKYSLATNTVRILTTIIDKTKQHTGFRLYFQEIRKELEMGNFDIFDTNPISMDKSLGKEYQRRLKQYPDAKKIIDRMLKYKIKNSTLSIEKQRFHTFKLLAKFFSLKILNEKHEIFNSSINKRIVTHLFKPCGAVTMDINTKDWQPVESLQTFNQSLIIDLDVGLEYFLVAYHLRGSKESKIKRNDKIAIREESDWAIRLQKYQSLLEENKKIISEIEIINLIDNLRSYLFIPHYEAHKGYEKLDIIKIKELIDQLCLNDLKILSPNLVQGDKTEDAIYHRYETFEEEVIFYKSFYKTTLSRLNNQRFIKAAINCAEEVIDESLKRSNIFSKINRYSISNKTKIFSKDINRNFQKIIFGKEEILESQQIIDLQELFQETLRKYLHLTTSLSFGKYLDRAKILKKYIPANEKQRTARQKRSVITEELDPNEFEQLQRSEFKEYFQAKGNIFHAEVTSSLITKISKEHLFGVIDKFAAMNIASSHDKEAELGANISYNPSIVYDMLNVIKIILQASNEKILDSQVLIRGEEEDFICFSNSYHNKTPHAKFRKFRELELNSEATKGEIDVDNSTEFINICTDLGIYCWPVKNINHSLFDLDGNSRLIDLIDRNNIAKSFGNMIYGSGIANLFYSVGEENINYNKIYGTELLFSI